MQSAGGVGSELGAQSLDQTLELRAPLVGRERSHVAAVELQQVERHERRGDLAGELVHARRGRVQPELQRLEVHHAVRDHHDLAVHHVRGGRLAASSSTSSGK